jgi:RNA polymerase sigma factor (sigma-70 family)
MVMELISDNLLVKQIKSEDSHAFEVLYKFYFPTIAHHIRKNSGNRQDAEDIFQESIMVLLHKIRQPDFVLTCSLKTYLFAIAKNLWLKRLKNDKYLLVDANDFFEIPEKGSEDFDMTVNQEKTPLQSLENWLERITENCRKILKALFFYEEPMETLMQKMGWKNKHTAANQKYKCIEQVKKESKKKGL